MCGIAGILGLTDRDPDLALLGPMLGSMVHRGPDDEGQLAVGRAVLGMRRLSIMDPTPRGHQPMTSPDGRFTIVYNGEIYNFLELADELAAQGRTFSSESDTEVLLAAYAAWGPDCARRLNGIWAFAIWDARERSLFLCRDRFGVKPLYLAEGGGMLAFASEIKALRTLPWVSSAPDVEVAARYLVDGTLARGRRTFFKDVECFPPAHSLLIRDGNRHWDNYWPAPGLSKDSSFAPQPGDAGKVEEFKSLLIDSVALQLQSDVAIGSCLSGGMDSSSIVSIAAGLRSGRLLAPGHAPSRTRGHGPACLLRPVPRGGDRRAAVRGRRRRRHGRRPPNHHSRHQRAPRIAARDPARPGRAVRVHEHRRPAPRHAHRPRSRCEGPPRRSGSR